MPKFYRFNKETKQEQRCEFDRSHERQLQNILGNAKLADINKREHQLELINTWNRQGLHSLWEYYL